MLAVQGGGYVVAGLAMLAWRKEDDHRGDRGLEQPAGVADEGRA